MNILKGAAVQSAKRMTRQFDAVRILKAGRALRLQLAVIAYQMPPLRKQPTTANE